MAGFYRKYVNGYANNFVPMTDQLKGAAITFHWGEEQQQSFDKLKVALATAPTHERWRSRTQAAIALHVEKKRVKVGSHPNHIMMF